MRRRGKNSWRTAFLALVMLMISHCWQSRRSNSSKSAWWKFGSSSAHPFLPQAGRGLGPHGRDGADVFSFSVALREWFCSSTEHAERYVCACEDTRTTEGALLEGSWAQEASGLSVIFQAAVATWHKCKKYKWSLLDVWLGSNVTGRTHTHTCTNVHKHRYVSLVAGPTLQCA